MFDDKHVREKEGREMELHRLAAANSINKLSEFHTYIDGTADIPMLTPEVVVGDD